MNNREIITVLTKVSQALEKLNIAYFVGGSIASSLYGVPRSTLDIDIISDMRLFHVRKLIELLLPLTLSARRGFVIPCGTNGLGIVFPTQTRLRSGF